MAQPPTPSTTILDEWDKVAEYRTYEYAQQAVDYLADQKFPVEKTTIVGLDLKLVERITGRLSWGKVIVGGIGSGLLIGLWIGLLLAIFLADGTGAGWTFVLNALWFGAVLGLVLATLGYAFQRGQRDFSSVSQTVASTYHILVEPSVAAEAAQMLATPSEPAGPTGPATGAASGAVPEA